MQLMSSMEADLLLVINQIDASLIRLLLSQIIIDLDLERMREIIPIWPLKNKL